MSYGIFGILDQTLLTFIEMNPIDNPYTPGAGTPPPELAGRGTILLDAENTIKRTINGKAAKSQIMLGLRGVGKTVLLTGLIK